jgi:gliding motility-associated-like protein
MKNYSLLLILSITTLFSYSQEICDNGIDDDGNGLIDLNDKASCDCDIPSHNLKPVSLFNASFEDSNCCPSFPSQFSCVTQWIPAWASPDYFNCGFVPLSIFNPAPVPYPDGTGCVGFINGWTAGTTDSKYKEYFGTASIPKLMKGKTYQLVFYMSKGIGESNAPFAIYGSHDIFDLPFSYTGGPQIVLPTENPNWIVLDSTIVTVSNTVWTKSKFTFTPSKNIEAICFGGTAQLLNGQNYYYIDKLQLSEIEIEGNSDNILTSGNICNNDLVLETNYYSLPNSIQWYKEGIAILGETSSSLVVPPNTTGQYQVRTTYNDGCTIATYNTFTSEFKLIMPNVFSPNGDKINDLFKPISYDCKNKTILLIYNRWGQIVFESTEFPLAWDGTTNGKDCSSGVYFWTIQLNGKEGEIRESGSVTLFR